tara:strand:- start:1145 stop:1834 length:690 start_codon:yes stop_codon:yes gene_type:complete
MNFINQLLSALFFFKNNFLILLNLCLPLIIIEVVASLGIVNLGINETMSNDLVIETIQPVAFPLLILSLLSLILTMAFYGAMMLTFKSIDDKTDFNIFNIYWASIKKFFPLLLSTMLASIAWAVGLILLILPGFYLFGRLGMYPAYIMFDDKGAIESLSNAWNASDQEGARLFFLTTIFLGGQFLLGFFIGSLFITNAFIFLVVAALKYFTYVMLFYLYYTLYKSIHLK